MQNQPMSIFGFSDRSVRSLVSASLSPNEKRLHFSADFRFSPNLGLSESLSERLIQNCISLSAPLDSLTTTALYKFIYLLTNF